MTVATTGTAPVQGELWSVRADDWASVHEPNMSPAYAVVLDLVHAGPGVEILEVGCGSGHRAAARRRPRRQRHGARRGARPSSSTRGAASRGADIRVGDLQFLPYADEAFDVVMGFNSFQYAADPMAALAEARRVLRPGGLVSALVWGPAEECELAPHLQAVGALMPPPPAGAPGPFSCSAPGALRALLEDGGFEVTVVGDAAAAFSYADEKIALRRPDQRRACRRRRSTHAGEHAVRNAVVEAIVPEPPRRRLLPVRERLALRDRPQGLTGTSISTSRTACARPEAARRPPRDPYWPAPRSMTGVIRSSAFGSTLTSSFPPSVLIRSVSFRDSLPLIRVVAGNPPTTT